MSVPLLLAAAAGAAFIAWRWRRLSWVFRVAGVLAVLALAAVGADLVQLPNVEETIKDAGEALGPYTYVLVGALAFLETGAFVGLIAPGEFTIVVGGVVAGQGEIDVVTLIAVVWVCAVAGDTTSFFLGRRLGRGFMVKHGPKVQITPARLEQVERFFHRHGGKTILIGRFVGLVRALAPFIAGASKMPYRRFAPYDIVGAGAWGTTFVILGYVSWRSFDQAAEIASKGALALGTVIVVTVGLVAAVRLLRHPEGRARARLFLHEQSERPLLRPLARLLRPVYRGVLRPAWRRAAGPLRFAWNRVTPGQLGLELTTLLAILSVGAYVCIGLVVVLGDQRFTIGDLRALMIVDDLRGDSLVSVAKVVTWLGSLTVATTLIALAASVLVTRRRIAEAGILVVGLALTFALVHILKGSVDRPRPVNPLVGTDGHSFPSGHAAYSVAYVAIAVALARSVSWLTGRVAVVLIAVALAAVIGITRIYLRAHFLSDVLGGWGLGAAVFAVCGLVALVIVHLRENGAPP